MLQAYSSFPYAGAKTGCSDELVRAKQFYYAFKNGRSFDPKGLSFDDVVEAIVKYAARCPVFHAPAVIVPVPRSGSSKKSFAPDADEFPNLALARRFALRYQTNLEVAELLVRQTPVACSSGSDRRVSLQEHVDSMVVVPGPALESERLVLVDDAVTKGTQTAACAVSLWRAGYQGTIEAFYVAHTLPKKGAPPERHFYQVHQIVWEDGDEYPRRIEVDQWRTRRADT